jgi:Flp pilus assembly protein TadD
MPIKPHSSMNFCRYSKRMMTLQRPAALILFAALLTAAAGCHHHPNQIGNSPTLAPDTAAARADTEKAYALIQAEKFKEAQPVLLRAIDADPSYGPAHNDLGLVRYHQGRLYDAAWEFERASRLMPRSPEPRNNLGLIHESAGKLTDAEIAYSQAYELAPDNVEYVGNLARVKIRRGERDQQTRHLLEQLVLSDPRPQWNQWARRNLSLLRQEDPSPLPSSLPASQPSR